MEREALATSTIWVLMKIFNRVSKVQCAAHPREWRQKNFVFPTHPLGKGGEVKRIEAFEGFFTLVVAQYFVSTSRLDVVFLCAKATMLDSPLFAIFAPFFENNLLLHNIISILS